MQIEIQVKDYTGIAVEKKKTVVTEVEIANKIEQDLDSLAEFVSVKGQKLIDGLIAVFDFCGRVDGKEFDGGKAENYELEIGSGMFIPGFEDQMLGMAIGEERVLKLQFPKDYQAEHLAGRDCEFTVRLNDIKRKQIPSLTDETVAKLNLESIKTVADYKELVQKFLFAEKERFNNNQAIDAIYQKLFQNNPFDIPAEMIDISVDKEVERAKSQAEQYCVPFEMFLQYQGIASEQEYKQIVANGVERLMRRDLILTAIAKKENLQVLDEEFENYYKMFAEKQNVSIEKAKETYSKDFLASKIILFKAEDFIVANAVITIVE